MKNLLYLCVLFLVLLEVSAPFSFGQSVRSLRGLQVMGVLVESLTPEGRRTGLTEEQIKTDVELQLRKVGIRVDDSADDYLYLNPHIIEVGEQDLFVYSMTLELFQGVTLTRDTSLSISAATWLRSVLGIIREEEARSGIRGSIRVLVDVFLNDYLTANPITR